MQKPVFVTGNPHKAKYLADMLGIDLDHRAVDVPEIQDLDIEKVVTAKAKAAYEVIGQPVIVEDAALYFDAWGRLPGVFTKFMETELGYDAFCRLLDSFDGRGATGEAVYCLFDGKGTHMFRSSVHGTIADHPRGTGGFGYDPVFVPEGSGQTRSEMEEEERDRTNPRYGAVIQLRDFLQSLGH